jgi:deoxyribodipyrimidine photo-lyase
VEPVIVWIKEGDLRLTDHPALYYAAESGSPIIVVFNYSEKEHHPWELGEASRFWLHHSLSDFEKLCKKKKIPLYLFKKESSVELLGAIIKKTKANALYFHLSYEPHLLKRDQKVYQSLQSSLTIHAYHGGLLVDPNEVIEIHKKPYKVFTPFKNCVLKCCLEKPLPFPKKMHCYEGSLGSLSIPSLKICPTTTWTKELASIWKVGTTSVEAKVSQFKKKASSYKKNRDFPAIDGTSKLSAPLHFGEISPRELWFAVSNESFRSEIIWREFAQHLLVHFPHTPEKPLREEFSKFPWRRSTKDFKAWKEGKTGYPYIDAGMRQLSQTGWMHNRVRMAVASFLIKDLKIHWLEGAKWFWEKLVDADLCSNTLNWQWSAGSGADAAPYFRIFNPMTQGKKFDPDGEYVREYVPELAQMPNKYIHEPWKAPVEVLSKAGITLGKDYPMPIVDHDEARKEALAIFRKVIKK